MNFGNSNAIATKMYVNNINNQTISSLIGHKVCDGIQIYVAMSLATSNIVTEHFPLLFHRYFYLATDFHMIATNMSCR